MSPRLRQSITPLLLLLGVTMASCAEEGRGAPDPSRRHSAAMAAVEASALHDAALAELAAPQDDAFRRVIDGAMLPSRIVSVGWREAARQRFDLLGARAPDSADGPTRVGISQFEGLALDVRLEGARPSEATLDGGRVLYSDALAHTDRILLANAHRLEELLVLEDSAAPHAFTWTMNVADASGGAHLRSRGGGVVLEDAEGRTRLAVSAPAAYDARGQRLAVQTTWNPETHAFTVTLAPRADPLAYPLVVDPIYDASVWVDAATRVPSLRSGGAMAYDAARHEVVMFGGVNTNTGYFGDTWAWNGSLWRLYRPTTSPSPRAYHALAFDSTRNEVVLFGGEDRSNAFNDTWAWNGTTWTERIPAQRPSARSTHAMVYDSARAEVVMFGGGALGTSTYSNETWVWGSASQTWTQRAPATRPPARHLHALAFDEFRGETVMFGGAGVAAQTWVWSGTDWSLRAPAASPAARYGHAMTYVGPQHQVVLLGGYGGGGTTLRDFWIWNGTAQSWTAGTGLSTADGHANFPMAYDAQSDEVLMTSSNAAFTDQETWSWRGSPRAWTKLVPVPRPSPRVQHAMAYDATRNEVLLYGGTGASDTWAWSGASSSWTLRASGAGGPGERTRTAMTYDAARAQVVLFGGTSATATTLNDTWTWSGTTSTWTRRAPSQSPAPIAGHSLTYDEARREAILFGGADASQLPLQDTWAWDGSNWAHRTPATAPLARFDHVAAWDPLRGEIVLFGGTSYTGFNTPPFADTWAWNGTTWTRRTTLLAPPGRSASALAYDAVARSVVLFGGYTASSSDMFSLSAPTNDTWVWNGAGWARAPTNVAPLARQGQAMAFDSGRGEMVLFGGSDASANLLGDTWIRGTLGGGCASSEDCIETGYCVDGVCCNVPSCGTCETCAGTSPGRCVPVTNAEDADSCNAASHRSCNRLGECKIALGEAATNASDCASGFIVDGVCCATASCGICQTCDAKQAQGGLNPGRCDYIKEGTDPRDECRDEGAASCKHDGTCDGRGACRQYAKNTPCGNNLCSRNASTGQFCTGAGECLASSDAVECGSFACRDGACRVGCRANDDCSALHHCENSTCVADRGATCSADGHTVVSPEGSTLDCAPYRCQGASCRDSCASRTECSGDADCTAQGKCVLFGGAAASSDGGGCNAANAAGHGGGVFALMLAACLARRTRRTQRVTKVV